jgi:hypothetical protein
MVNANECQKKFVDSITKGIFPGDFLEGINPGGKLSAKGVLEVYQGDYFSRLYSVLKENFKGVYSFLGDDLFFSLCKEYIDQYASTSEDIGNYGEFLRDFVRDHPLGEKFPFLSELCELDQSFLKLFHAPGESFSVGSLALPDDLELCRFVLIDAMFLISSQHPIYQIWELKNRTNSETKIDIDWYRRESFCLYKVKDGIKFRSLTLGQFEVLNRIKQGDAIGQCLEKVDVAPQEVQELFYFISTSGILKDVLKLS